MPSSYSQQQPIFKKLENITSFPLFLEFFIEDVPQLVASSAMGMCDIPAALNFISSVLYILIELVILVYKIFVWSECTTAIELPEINTTTVNDADVIRLESDSDNDSVGNIRVDDYDSSDSKQDMEHSRKNFKTTS